MAEISIDWGTSIISIPKLYLSHVSGVIYSLNTNQFRLDLKALEDDAEGIGFTKTHNHNTEITLGGTVYARTVEILDPYTITFEDGAYRVILQVTNNNILDVTNVNQVSVSSTNSAGLVVSEGTSPAAIADAVWDALSVDYEIAGSFGRFMTLIKRFVANPRWVDEGNSLLKIMNEANDALLHSQPIQDKDDKNIVLQGTGPVKLGVRTDV